jgi:tetratricopeptide (TPR) repeat protein
MARASLPILIAFLFAFSGNAAHAVFPESGDSEIERPPIYYSGIKAIEDGDYAKGLEIMQSFVDEDPQDADAWALIGFSLRKTKRYVDSEHAYQKALEADPKNLAANAYAAKLYLETGRVQEAEQKLAVLGELCAGGKGCEERERLAGMIEAYKKTGEVGSDW